MAIKKNHSFPAVHAPKFSYAPTPSLSCVYPLLHEMARRKQRSASFSFRFLRCFATDIKCAVVLLVGFELHSPTEEVSV